jgi:hypothetical protein
MSNSAMNKAAGVTDLNLKAIWRGGRAWSLTTREKNWRLAKNTLAGAPVLKRRPPCLRHAIINDEQFGDPD